MVRQDEIVLLRKDSVTYKIVLDHNTFQFCKSYHPDEVSSALRRILRTERPAFSSPPYQRDTQLALYNRELALLKVLGDIGGGLVPMVCGNDRTKLEIFMEYIERGTYQTEFLKVQNDETRQRALCGEMSQLLARFHSYCNDNLDHILLKANSERQVLRTRSIDEEAGRLERHLLASFYVCSSNQAIAEMRKSEKSYENSALQSKDMRKLIRQALKERGIALRQEAKRIIRYGRSIMRHGTVFRPSNPIRHGQDSLRYGEMFVHGDFQPQNLFYIPLVDASVSSVIKLCDFDKARLGSPEEDLVGALFNIHRFPQDEERHTHALSLARKYYEDMGIKSSELNDRLAALVCIELKESLRFLGVLSKLSWPEICWFSGEAKEKDDSVSDSYSALFKKKQDFLQHRFVSSIHWLLDYYLTGQGKRDLVDKAERQHLVKQQLKGVKAIFERGEM